MVLNEEKQARLAEVLALRQDVVADVSASAPSAPPSASFSQGLLALEGGGESVLELAPAPELPLVLQQILKGY